MKLRYYIKDKKKVYTLKSEHNSKPTIDAHHKFIKLKSFKENQEQKQSE